jgi:hypothetical protein
MDRAGRLDYPSGPAAPRIAASPIGTNRMDATPWEVWRRLTRRFSIARMPMECLVSPGAWGFFGSDVVSGLRRNRSTAMALTELESLELRAFEEVAALAEVNQRRQDAAFRVTALMFVIGPVISGIVLDLFAPATMGMVRRSDSWTLPALVLFAALVLLRLAGLWRARQLVSVIEIARVMQRRPLRRSGSDGEERGS